MTEENFFDMFNRVHNPDYYYGKQKKTKKRETNEKKKNRKRQHNQAISHIQSIELNGVRPCQRFRLGR